MKLNQLHLLLINFINFFYKVYCNSCKSISNKIYCKYVTGAFLLPNSFTETVNSISAFCAINKELLLYCFIFLVGLIYGIAIGQAIYREKVQLLNPDLPDIKYPTLNTAFETMSYTHIVLFIIYILLLLALLYLFARYIVSIVSILAAGILLGTLSEFVSFTIICSTLMIIGLTLWLLSIIKANTLEIIKPIKGLIIAGFSTLKFNVNDLRPLKNRNSSISHNFNVVYSVLPGSFIFDIDLTNIINSISSVYHSMNWSAIMILLLLIGEAFCGFMLGYTRGYQLGFLEGSHSQVKNVQMTSMLESLSYTNLVLYTVLFLSILYCLYLLIRHIKLILVVLSALLLYGHLIERGISFDHLCIGTVLISSLTWLIGSIYEKSTIQQAILGTLSLPLRHSSPYKMLIRSYSTSNQDLCRPNPNLSSKGILIRKVDERGLSTFRKSELFSALVKRNCLYTAQDNLFLANNGENYTRYTEAFKAYEELPLILKKVNINYLATYYNNKISEKE